MAVLRDDIELKLATPYIWNGEEVPVWYVTYHDGRSFCPPVVFFDGMSAALQVLFMQWLDARQLSVTMPPSLPKPGRVYYLDDVQSAIEGTTSWSD